MDRIGRYSLVRELSRKPYGTIYAAQADGENEARYVIKVFNPMGTAQADLPEDRLVQAFLESAAVQKKVADSGARHWAPMYETGYCPDGGYYVSRFYTGSTKRLVDGRVHLPGEALRAISLGVLEGLLELKSAVGRAHGELFLPTVLVNREQINKPAGTVLADPAPADVAAERGEVGDVADLGKILYQLITHRQYTQTTVWPLQAGAEWQHLGRSTNAWLELVNFLLDPDAKPDTHNLAAVKQRIGQMGPGRSKLPKILIGAALLVVLVGGGGGLWYWNRLTEWKDYYKLVEDPNARPIVNVYTRYCSNEALRAALARPEMEKYPSIAQLRKTLDDMRSREVALDPASLSDLGSESASGASWAVLRSPRWHTAAADLEALKHAIEGWKVPQELRGAIWKLGDWMALRGRVEATVTDASLYGDRIKPDAMLAAAQWNDLLKAFDWSDAMRKLRTQRQRLEQFHDPLLALFGDLVESVDTAGKQAEDPAALAEVKTQLDSCEALGSELEKAVQDEQVRKRLLLDVLKGSDYYTQALAAVPSQGVAGRISAIRNLLGQWPGKAASVPMPTRPDNSPLSEKLTLLQKEYGLISETVDTEDAGILSSQFQRAGQLLKDVQALNPRIPSEKDQYERLSQTLDRSLIVLGGSVAKARQAAEARAAMFDDLAGQFSASENAIQAQIDRVGKYNEQRALKYSSDLAQAKTALDDFLKNWKRKPKPDIEQKAGQLRDLVAGLLDRATKDMPPEPPVAKLKYVPDAKLPEALRSQLTSLWDGWDLQIVGQRVNEVTKAQNKELEQAREQMLKVEQAAAGLTLPTFSATAPQAKAAAAELDKLGAAHAATLIQQAVRKPAPGPLDLVDPQAVAAIQPAQQKWTQQAQNWLKTWDEIEGALDAGKDLNEKASSETVASLVSTAGTLAGELQLPDNLMSGLKGRIADLQAFDALAAPTTDAERATRLDQAAKAMAKGRPALALAAARRLAAWKPVTSTGSAVEFGKARQAAMQAAGSWPADLQKALGTQLEAVASEALKSLVRASLADASKIDSSLNATAIAELRRSLGMPALAGAGDENAKLQAELQSVGLWDNPAVRYDLALRQVRGQVDQVKDNDTAVKAVEALTGALPSGWQTGISDPAAKKMLTDLQALRKKVADFASPVSAEGGPQKTANFQQAPVQDPNVLVFSRRMDGEVKTLAFRRLTSGGGKIVFLCTTETPVWAVQALLDDGKKLTDTFAIDPVAKDADGARAWFAEKQDRLLTRPTWLPEFESGTPGFRVYPKELASGRGRQMNRLDDPQNLGLNPTIDDPMNFIAPDSAMKIARALGCRLPTAAEWETAAAQQQNPPNLRDQAWQLFANHLRSIPDATRLAVTPDLTNPDEISYKESRGSNAWTSAGLQTALQKLPAAPRWNIPTANMPGVGDVIVDNFIFFRPVAVDSAGYAFKDLIGNVAEYVADAAQPTNADRVTVAGASALSPPDVGVGVFPISWASVGIAATSGFSDVGFRLAFEAKEEGPRPEIAADVKQLLQQAQYLPLPAAQP